MPFRRFGLVLLAAIVQPWGAVLAQDKASADGGNPGSPSFCLFEVPAEGSQYRRWVNLGIVQYVESGSNEVRLVFGGGNLGSGHEVRIPMATPDDGLAFIERLRSAAGQCRQGSYEREGRRAA